MASKASPQNGIKLHTKKTCKYMSLLFLHETWRLYHEPAANACKKSCSRPAARSRAAGRASGTAAARAREKYSGASSLCMLTGSYSGTSRI